MFEPSAGHCANRSDGTNVGTNVVATAPVLPQCWAAPDDLDHHDVTLMGESDEVIRVMRS
jgi:hypothetical protein